MRFPAGARAAVVGWRADGTRLEKYRDRALRRLVAHAYERVPHYRRVLDGAGVGPEDIHSVGDLPLVPITTREQLQSLPLSEWVSRGTDPSRLQVTRTSGSSGRPLEIRRPWTEQALLHLFRLRAWRALGLRARDRVVRVAPPRLNPPGRFTRLANALGLWSRHSVDLFEPPERIVEALRSLRPDVLSGYPSALLPVADHLSQSTGEPVRPRLVLSGSEVLPPHARQRLEAAFGAPVRETYGTHEFNIVGWECAETGRLHVCDDALVLEAVRDGRPAAEGEVGEAIVTGLHSYALPFLRYRLGDLVVRGPSPCPCGAPFSTLEIVAGRMLDRLPLPDGRELHPYALVDPLMRNHAAWVGRYQIVQERPDRLLLRVVARRRPSAEAVRRLREDLAERVGPAVSVGVALVDEIRREPNGKYRVSLSRVRSEYAEAVVPTPAALLRSLGSGDARRLFIHDAGTLPEFGSLMASRVGLRNYEGRALVLARRGDVVCVSQPPDPAYLAFLATLGLGPRPEDVVVVREDLVPGQRSLVQSLLADRDARGMLADRLSGSAAVALHPFACTSFEMRLADRLSSELGIEVRLLGGDPAATERALRKDIVRERAEALGIPLAPGTVITLRADAAGRPDLRPLRCAIDRFRKSTGRAIVRGSLGVSGSETWVIDDRDSSAGETLRELAARGPDRTYLVDEMWEPRVSPNVQMWIEAAGPVHCLGVSDQRWKAPLVHGGNAWPSTSSRTDGMVAAAEALCGWLAEEGVTGLVGFDFVEPIDPRAHPRGFFLAEANPRVNGATYPFALVERLSVDARRTGRPVPAAFISAHLPAPTRGFRELARLWSDRLYDAARGSGVLPYDASLIPEGRLTVAVFGRTRGDAAARLEELRPSAPRPRAV